MPISEATYQQVALEDPSGQWELTRGRLRSKPGMTTPHNESMHELGGQLWDQLDRKVYAVRINTGRLRISTGTYYIPDVCVIPREFVLRKLREIPDQLEVYEEPLPLVVEVWSPSTGDYDVEEKLREYQRRGDLEIWRIHPYERTLIAWRLQPDGGYSETHYRDGSMQPASLPGVTIELDVLFPT